MQIEIEEAPVLRDVLLREVAEERTLAAPGLPEYREVHRSLSICELQRAMRRFVVLDG